MLTNDYTHTQVVALAVFELGGAEKYIDTEDVAIKANDLAPGRFCWQKYPDRINLEAVRKRLSDAKKAEHGSLVTGSPKKGWLLTHSGLKWAKCVSENYVAQHGDRTKPIAGSADINRYKREKQRLAGSDAWNMWVTSKKDITELHAKAVFRIDSYTTDEAKVQKIDRLRKLMIEDAEITEFLDEVAKLID